MHIETFRTNLAKTYAIFLLSLSIASCGGGNESRVDDITNGGGDGVSRVEDITNGGGEGFSRVDDITNSSSSSSSSNSGISAPALSYLDCSNLDPSKVYLLGTLNPPNGGYEALVDIDDPTKFCVGFAGDIVEYGIALSESGQLIAQYTDTEARNIYKLTQEALGVATSGTEWEWVYPQDVMDNDEKLLSPSAAANSLFLKHNENTNTDDIYYQHNQTGLVFSNITGSEPYYDNPNNLGLLSVLPDGRLLMDDDTSLYIVGTDLNETQLTPPTEGSFFFEATSRLFIDAETGNQSVWILVQDSDFTNDRRWRIDLETLSVKDDGLFAPAPDIVDLTPYINPNTAKPLRNKYKKLNDNGDLVQTATYSSPPSGAVGDITTATYESLILRRPIGSSGADATIVHSDAEYPGEFKWKKEPLPFVHIFSGVLVTGP